MKFRTILLSTAAAAVIGLCFTVAADKATAQGAAVVNPDVGTLKLGYLDMQLRQIKMFVDTLAIKQEVLQEGMVGLIGTIDKRLQEQNEILRQIAADGLLGDGGGFGEGGTDLLPAPNIITGTAYGITWLNGDNHQSSGHENRLRFRQETSSSYEYYGGAVSFVKKDNDGASSSKTLGSLTIRYDKYSDFLVYQSIPQKTSYGGANSHIYKGVTCPRKLPSK